MLSSSDVWVNSVGELYIADVQFVRKVTAFGSIVNIAGGGAFEADNTPATASSLNYAFCIKGDVYGNIYISPET